jgi:signal peptidase I
VTVTRVTRDVALALAGAVGAACILWFIAANLFGASLVTFRTGSMAPTMPTGTAAIAVRVDAEDIRVGDVLTVQRPDQLPITHRVTRTEDGGGGTVVVQLQGDANAVPDPEPYRLTEAMKIVLPMPGLGMVVLLMQTPLFLGAATLLVAGLMFWAFWPARSDDQGDAMDAAPTDMKELTGVTR